ERGYIEVRQRGEPVQQLPLGGVGFVFDGKPDSDGLVYAGVDFDSKALKGQILSFSRERVKRFGSYIETSVSGTGVHVIVKVNPLASGISHNGIEMYTSGRYFTMTGQTGTRVRPIIAAPVAFAAHDEELQSKIKNARGGDNHQAKHTDAENSAWFDKLSVEKQNEVVRYAALHIAKNSNLFELTANCGNYQEYFKLTLAITRSAVPDAEDIFVEAASIANDPDPEETLRTFFQNCERAEQRSDDITVGTLLHTASQCGAVFTQWKQITAGRDPDVAMFVPGNEEDCRNQLARVVA